MLIYSIGAGFCAASGPIFMKLAFPDGANTETNFLFYFYISCFTLSNILMWWLHSKAMQTSDSTIKAVVLNTGSNFIFTSLFGWIIFKEEKNFIWALGITFILLGITIISKTNNQPRVKTE